MNTKTDKHHYRKPLALGEMTREELDAALQLAMDDIEAGNVFSADEVEAEMERWIRETKKMSSSE